MLSKTLGIKPLKTCTVLVHTFLTGVSGKCIFEFFTQCVHLLLPCDKDKDPSTGEHSVNFTNLKLGGKHYQNLININIDNFFFQNCERMRKKRQFLCETRL